MKALTYFEIITLERGFKTMIADSGIVVPVEFLISVRRLAIVTLVLGMITGSVWTVGFGMI